jgi:hypothetical protein
VAPQTPERGTPARPRSAAPAPSPRAAPVPSPRPAPGHAGQPQAHRHNKPPAVTLLAAEATPQQAAAGGHQRIGPAVQVGRARYQHRIPPSVWTALVATAKAPLRRAEPVYRDVGSQRGVGWELLAACDWMQCKARPGYSPVHGERLGTFNADGTIYHTKSEALAQCADDLVALAGTVYHIDLRTAAELSIRDLACVFAAFRWGGLLKIHHTSAMEFPYSVAGLTVQHTNMRWPRIDDPNTPDKPGGRFKMPFGAVPVVLSLHYPATV